MQGKFNIYPHPFEIPTIISILVECADLIVKKEHKAVIESFDLSTEDSVPATLDLNELENFLLETEVIVDNYDKFASLFEEAASTHSEKMVSSIVIGKLLKEFEPPLNIKQLVSQGWVLPFTKDNKKKVGWYMAGGMLQKRIKADNQQEPTDPIEKALFLRERRPHIEKMLEDLDEERRLFLEENDRKREPWLAQLDRCKKSDELIALLGDV